jgi:hypothetical protein
MPRSPIRSGLTVKPIVRQTVRGDHQDRKSKGRQDVADVVLVQEPYEADCGRGAAGVSLHGGQELDGLRVHRHAGIHLLHERRGSPPGLSRLGELFDSIWVASVRPRVACHRPRSGLKPDQAGHAVRARGGQERARHATVSRREQKRPLLTRSIENCQQIGRPSLEIRQTSHIVGQSGPAPVMDGHPRA